MINAYSWREKSPQKTRKWGNFLNLMENRHKPHSQRFEWWKTGSIYLFSVSRQRWSLFSKTVLNHLSVTERMWRREGALRLESGCWDLLKPGVVLGAANSSAQKSRAREFSEFESADLQRELVPGLARAMQKDPDSKVNKLLQKVIVGEMARSVKCLMISRRIWVQSPRPYALLHAYGTHP